MIKGIKKFFAGSIDELKKVIWPSRREVMSHTMIVIISIGVAMAIVLGIDLILSNLIQWLIYRS